MGIISTRAGDKDAKNQFVAVVVELAAVSGRGS